MTPSPLPAARRRLRSLVGPVRRKVVGTLFPTVTITLSRWDTASVQRIPGRTRRYRLHDPKARFKVSARTVKVVAPDLAALTRFATSGLAGGWTQSIVVAVSDVPAQLRTGVVAPRTLKGTAAMSRRTAGTGIRAELAWTGKRPMDRALTEILTLASREHGWPQTGGPIFADDRRSFLTGASTWPRSSLVESAPADPEKTGPYLSVPGDAERLPWPLITSVANACGRAMVGTPTPYTLSAPGEETLVLRDAAGYEVLLLDPHRSPEARGDWERFAAITVTEPLPATPFVTLALRALTASGAILCPATDHVRTALANDGYVTGEADALASATGAAVLEGYALSVASSRASVIAGDAVLRQTALAGRTRIPLPAVSFTVSSKRPDDVEQCLGYLAAQTYPAYEVLLGTHGYVLEDSVVAGLRERFAVPLRVLPLPEEMPFGQVLGELSRAADGELVSKVDDDDHYGPDHLLDLMLAFRTSGADIVAKSSRFTYFQDEGFTIDRTWGAKEMFDVTPAGGTLLLSRATLAEIGGWSTSPRHVDTDLLLRARAFGVPRYRTHSLGYVYVRRSSGHTWAADHEDILGQGEDRYDGLPGVLLR